MSLLSSKLVKAIITPLASIFGSGFLILIGVLGSAVGAYASYAMITICILAFLVGQVIRYNIKNVEPILAKNTHKLTNRLENSSDFALSLAYTVSVCLYIQILSSYVLSSFGPEINTQFNQNVLTSSIIGLIVFIGLLRGLNPLEFLETYALYSTLLIVVIIIVGFGIYDTHQLLTGKLIMPTNPSRSFESILSIRVVAGVIFSWL